MKPPVYLFAQFATHAPNVIPLLPLVFVEFAKYHRVAGVPLPVAAMSFALIQLPHMFLLVGLVSVNDEPAVTALIVTNFPLTPETVHVVTVCVVPLVKRIVWATKPSLSLKSAKVLEPVIVS